MMMMMMKDELTLYYPILKTLSVVKSVW